MKQKIEEEIKGINDSHKKIFFMITKAFENEHLNLNIKEKEVKKELDEKVEQIKIELQNFLRESNNIFLSCEKVYNSIQVYKEKFNEMKTLYYISEINKNNEKAINLFSKPMKNLNIIFPNPNILSNAYTPKYNFYYFSGIPIPNNINICKKEEQALISWNIDELRFEYKNIKYSVEIKEDSNENFSSFLVPESNLLFKYKINTDYEIKIRVMIDGLYGEYSEINRFNEKNLYNNTGSLFWYIDNKNTLFGNKLKANNIFGQNSSLLGINDDKLLKNESNKFSLFGTNNDNYNLKKNEVNISSGGLFGNCNISDKNTNSLFGNINSRPENDSNVKYISKSESNTIFAKINNNIQTGLFGNYTPNEHFITISNSEIKNEKN